MQCADDTAIFFFLEPLYQNFTLILFFFLFLHRSSHACILTNNLLYLIELKCKNLFSCNDSISNAMLPFVKEWIFLVLWNVLILIKCDYLTNENKAFINHALNLLFFRYFKGEVFLSGSCASVPHVVNLFSHSISRSWFPVVGLFLDR